VTIYTVRKGDTLGAIARRFYGATSRFPLIVSANRIANPDRLRIGQSLIIPDADAAPASGSEENDVALPPAYLHFRALSEKRLAALNPQLSERGRTMLDRCARGGLALLVTQGLRTWEEQDALFAQGRTAPGKIVTNARGGQSYHNFGLAFDVLVLDAMGKAEWDPTHPGWRQAADVGKALGLEWGGDWQTIKDQPHFQYTGGLTLERCRELFPGGLPTIWLEVK
jgi:phage tail protein X